MIGTEIFLIAIAGYVTIGMLFGLAFVIVGVSSIDPAARGTSTIFRLVILPGSIALWPLLIVKWIGATRRAT